MRNRFLVFWCIIKTIPLVSDRREESAPVQQVLNEGTIKEASCCFSHTWCAFNWLINGSLCVVISNIPPPFKTFALFNMNSALTCFSFILHPSFIMAYIWSSVLPSSIETSFDFFLIKIFIFLEYFLDSVDFGSCGQMKPILQALSDSRNAAQGDHFTNFKSWYYKYYSDRVCSQTILFFRLLPNQMFCHMWVKCVTILEVWSLFDPLFVQLLHREADFPVLALSL